MKAKSSLRRRILGWLLLYVSLLSVAIFVGGLIVNEEAERMVWRSLLLAELDQYGERRATDPTYQWPDTDQMHLYHYDEPHLPQVLRALAPGLHDETWVEGKLCVVLVQDLPEGRVAIALDITEFEGLEFTISSGIVAGMFATVLISVLLLGWALGRVIRPLARVAESIANLRPEQTGERIALDPNATVEAHVIADAFNGYLERNEKFVERERAFIDSASHELRTPIAVISGAARLAEQQSGIPPAAREQMQRVSRSARQIEELISLLLVLAKDPERLTMGSESIALDEWLPGIVDDHRHLLRDRQLQVRVDVLPHVQVTAPPGVLHATVGNLLRNAIEHSDSGEIGVQLDSDGTVTITDPGHGMSPEDISALYARLARGGSRDGGGIGLELIARLCEHLGWELSIDSAPGGGTRARLRLHARPHAS